MTENPEFIVPDWPAPDSISARVTTRKGGCSQAPFATFNLGDHVGDDPAAVASNRRLLRETLSLPGKPRWLEQVHGMRVVDAAAAGQTEKADASYVRQPGIVCAVMTADCLPVFFCAADGSEVAVAHAGWRGLAAGVLEATVEAMTTPAGEMLAWLGPAIGPEAFEVGEEVRMAFVRKNPAAEAAFSKKQNGKWLADIYALARIRLGEAGVTHISGGGFCTFKNAEQFFSYRRDGATGRMASLIWINSP